MKKWTRGLALLMMLVLVVGVFSACGDEPTNGDGSSTTTTTGTNNVLGEDKVVDMGGKEFIVASAWLRNTPPRNATTFERLWHQQKEKVEKDYNCKITIETFYASMEGLLPKILAKDKVGDVVQMISDMWMPAVGAGYLRPWEDVSDVVNINDPRWISPDSTAVNGKHYVLDFERPGDVGTILWYNKDVLAKAGITEDPAQLAKEGKWTWEKFREMLQSCTMDTDNDGAKDVFGLVSFTGYSDIAFALARSNGSGMLSLSGQTFTNEYTTPAFMEAINFFDKLVNTDKVLRIYENMTGGEETWNNMPATDTIFGEFRNGVVGFMSGRMWVGNQQLKPYMTSNYGMVVYPKGPQASDYILDAQTMGGYALTVTNKDYKNSAIIFNALAHPVEGYEDDAVMQEVIASDFFQDGDTNSYDMYKLAAQKVKVDFGYGVRPLYSQVNHAIIQSVFWHIDTPAAAIEGLKGLNDEDVGFTYEQLFK